MPSLPKAALIETLLAALALADRLELADTALHLNEALITLGHEGVAPPLCDDVGEVAAADLLQ